MRTCIDANILIKGLAGTGQSRFALDLTLQFAILITSEYILKEVEKNLAKVGVSKDTAKHLVQTLYEAAEIVEPARFREVITNEKYDPVLGTAIAGTCDFLVTDDLGIFNRRHRFFGTDIVSLQHYLSVFEGRRKQTRSRPEASPRRRKTQTRKWRRKN
jgi:predicted nucleic acid-binding protein